MQIHAAILAGGSVKPWMGDVPSKALLPVLGKPMVVHVVDALHESNVIDRIVAIGPQQALHQVLGQGVLCLEGKDNLIDNACALLDQFADDDRVLLATADIPFLTGQAVKDVVEFATLHPCDGIYTFVAQAELEAQFPGARRTYVKMKEGQFTGGNITILRAGAIKQCKPLLDQLTQNRKNPLKLAGMFGFSVFIKLLLGRLSIPQALKAAERLSGLKLCAYASPHACVGQDIDCNEDLAFLPNGL